MKCLVTGGSGYFGELLCKRLLERNYEVINFDLSQNPDEDERIRFVRGDIRNKQKVLSTAEDVDFIFHNVAQVPLAKNKDLFRTVNRDGTLNILEAGLQNNVKKLVYTSTSAIFGVPKSNPVDEKTPPTPMEAYGRAKYQGELFCEDYNKKGLDISIIRPRTILGLGRLGIFQILFEWVMEGKNVPVFNGGNNIYQFVHAYDLAEACILSAQQEGFNKYNIGAEKFGTMRELLQHLCNHAGTGSKVKSLPMWPAVMGMNITSSLGISPLGAYHALMYGRSLYFDTSKAKTELNWQPQYSSNEMMEESYDWYVKNREKIMGQKNASHHKSKVKQGVLSLVGKLL